MPLTIPSKPARNTHNTRSLLASNTALHKAVERITNVAARETLKDDKVQRAARLAIAETIDGWFAGIAENDPGVVEDVFVGLCVLATASNRGRIFKHAMMPEGVEARVDAELKRISEEQQTAETKATNAGVETAKAEVKSDQANKAKGTMAEAG